MALRQQRWSPDTCSCVFIQTWDDALDPTVRTHDCLSQEKLCAEHAAAGQTAGKACHDAILAENRRKNVVLWITQSSVKSTVTVADYQWTFDPSRKLQASIAGLSNSQKNQLQNACDLQFGPNLVLIV